MQKELSAQNDDIKKVQSDIQDLAELKMSLEKKISNEIDDLKNKKLKGLELIVKQLQDDLRNAKYEIDSLKQNNSKPVDYKKQLHKNQSQSETEKAESSLSKALAEKEKQYQSLEQKYETLMHEKQDLELKHQNALKNSQSEIEKNNKKFDVTKSTYEKQIKDLNEQLKRKEIKLPKVQSAGSEQITKLQSDLNKSENQCKTLLQEKKDAESFAVSLQATMNEYKQKIELLEQTNLEVTDKVKKQDHEINILKQQLEQTKTANEEREKTNLEIVNKMKEQEHEINTLKQQLEQTKTAKEDKGYTNLEVTNKAEQEKSTAKTHFEQMKATKEYRAPFESPTYNQSGPQVYQVSKTHEKSISSTPLKDEPTGISSNTYTGTSSKSPAAEIQVSIKVPM